MLYMTVNFAGMYTKYLTDRGQRKAFLETHRSMETRCRTQKENDRQEKLLLSGERIFLQLFMFPVSITHIVIIRVVKSYLFLDEKNIKC